MKTVNGMVVTACEESIDSLSTPFDAGLYSFSFQEIMFTLLWKWLPIIKVNWFPYIIGCCSNSSIGPIFDEVCRNDYAIFHKIDLVLP